MRLLEGSRITLKCLWFPFLTCFCRRKMIVLLGDVNQGFWSHLGCSSKNTNTCIFSWTRYPLVCTQRNNNKMVSFRSQIKLEPRLDGSPFGAQFKFSVERPQPFHAGIPSPHPHPHPLIKALFKTNVSNVVDLK